jgi:hypothetical protein
MTASAVSTQKLFSRLLIQAGLHVPTDTNANIHTVLGYVDIRDYDAIGAICQATTVAGNGITLMEIVAAVDNSGTNATQIKTTGAITTSSNAYYKTLEATAEEIAELGRASSLALRYVGVRLTCDNTSTRVATTYIRGLAKRPASALTADKTS